jgi:hypothetical protein
MLIQFIAVTALAAGVNQSAQPMAAMKSDVNRLVARAEKLKLLWPWQGPIPEVRRVARHGKRVAPLLVALLDDDPGFDPGGLDERVQQQAALALCHIFGVSEDCGHVYCNRALRDTNRGVKKFWLSKISESSGLAWVPSTRLHSTAAASRRHGSLGTVCSRRE